jgi:hypothetical protein
LRAFTLESSYLNVNSANDDSANLEDYADLETILSTLSRLTHLQSVVIEVDKALLDPEIVTENDMGIPLTELPSVQYLKLRIIADPSLMRAFGQRYHFPNLKSLNLFYDGFGGDHGGDGAAAYKFLLHHGHVPRLTLNVPYVFLNSLLEEKVFKPSHLSLVDCFEPPEISKSTLLPESVEVLSLSTNYEAERQMPVNSLRSLVLHTPPNLRKITFPILDIDAVQEGSSSDIIDVWGNFLFLSLMLRRKGITLVDGNTRTIQ